MTMFQQQHLFRSGDGGYFRYRIPALAVTSTGAILAFCEARKHTGRDSDQIDLLMRRSIDHGETFSEPALLFSKRDWVCGNPAPVLDRDTGRIWLLFCMNHKDDDEKAICLGRGDRSVWISQSDDDGVSWSRPRQITAEVKLPNWGWYATGPGHGIQLRSGRLLIPCDHSLRLSHPDGEASYSSHVILSDDHGASWRVGGCLPEGSNECCAIETVAGEVYLNARNAPWSLLARNGMTEDKNRQYHRIVAFSDDGGDSFGLAACDAALPEPICQASICRLTDATHHDRDRILFCNPAGPGRRDLTLRLSYDECRSWALSRTLHRGSAQYSDLCVAADMTILCFYERGLEAPYQTLTLARFDLGWLEAGPHAE